MVKSLVAAAFVCCLAPAQTPSSETLNQHDRDFAMSHMHATRKQFLDSVSGLTAEQWNFKAAPERWSIAECAEHIALAEDFISGRVRDQIVKTPADPAKRAEVKGKDEAIVKMVPDRSQKFKAPEVIAPKHHWATPEEAVAHFKESRDRNIEYINTTQDDLRDHFAAHPAMGMLDGYQWMLLMSAHSERHTEQINEVKADPNYPK